MQGLESGIKVFRPAVWDREFGVWASVFRLKFGRCCQ